MKKIACVKCSLIWILIDLNFDVSVKSHYWRWQWIYELHKNDSINLISVTGKLNTCNLWIRTSCHIESKAFSMSRDFFLASSDCFSSLIQCDCSSKSLQIEHPNNSKKNAFYLLTKCIRRMYMKNVWPKICGTLDDYYGHDFTNMIYAIIYLSISKLERLGSSYAYDFRWIG